MSKKFEQGFGKRWDNTQRKLADKRTRATEAAIHSSKEDDKIREVVYNVIKDIFTPEKDNDNDSSQSNQN
jgi:hypothetical protein